VISNLNKPLNWRYLSANKNITWDIIISNPNIPWDWQYVTINPNITWNIIENNLDKPWDSRLLSQNPNLTFDIVNNNLNKSWIWNELSVLESEDIKDKYIINKIKDYFVNNVLEELELLFLHPDNLRKGKFYDDIEETLTVINY
jgi:hypothetical protein